ncbi:hypothetical protein HMPREF1552_02416 [Leptotrichia sp. oral taxon 879 str. F0557]|nr:hypothetical protein HMPREF1552_02416 [Leptotrichia sp. oral taxon 879 str. F0557]
MRIYKLKKYIENIFRSLRGLVEFKKDVDGADMYEKNIDVDDTGISISYKLFVF